MIIEAFLRWSEHATAGERSAAAGALARAFVEREMAPEDRRAAEAALTLLLDDPSPKVRLAIAAAMATSLRAPRAIIHALTRDQIEVAGRVVAFSPVLSDGDLVDIVADCAPDVQRIVAMRQALSRPVSAAIAEVGGVAAVCDLLDNAGASIAPMTLRRIVERFGESAEVRACLLARPDLPCEIRHGLVMGVSAALAQFDLVRNTIGDRRVARITRDACLQATLHLAEHAGTDELAELVEHLRTEGHLTPALLMHALGLGRIDFFCEAIISLTDQPGTRVRGIIVDGRAAAMRALYRAAGISPATADVFVTATLIWRDGTRKRGISTTASVADRLMAAFAGAADENEEVADLLMLVEKLNMAYRRRVAREAALAMTGRGTEIVKAA